MEILQVIYLCFMLIWIAFSIRGIIHSRRSIKASNKEIKRINHDITSMNWMTGRSRDMSTHAIAAITTSEEYFVNFMDWLATEMQNAKN